MIQCPYCERSLGSDGSYRVHKHRFHSGLEYRQPVATHEEVQQSTPEPVEAEEGTEESDTITEDIYTPLKMWQNGATPELPQEEHESQEPEHHGRKVVERGKGGDDGIGGILAIGGVIAVGIILALLGKKQ